MKHRVGFGLCLFFIAVLTLHGQSALAQHSQIGDDIDGEAEDDTSGWSVSLSAGGSIVAIGAPFNGGFAGPRAGVRAAGGRLDTDRR